MYSKKTFWKFLKKRKIEINVNRNFDIAIKTNNNYNKFEKNVKKNSKKISNNNNM